VLSRTAVAAGNHAGDTGTVKPLAPGEFDQIRKLAHRTFGLDLKPGKEELVSARLRILVIKAGARSFEEYYRLVVRDSTGRSLAAMIDALATNHTSFLREPDHFEFLRRTVLPQVSDAGCVELWCAACSTGEEVWTLACILSGALPQNRIQIAASDISNKALSFASRGVYPADRCREIPAEWRTRYFEAEKGVGFRVSEKIRRLVSFRRLNLIDNFAWPQRFPIIFCRNVMIYFDRATQEKLVSRLADCLAPGGYLFVGHAESLSQVSHLLEYVQPAVYRKGGKLERRWRSSS
jgi:chemotaxis protein methyltransferase CheR